MLANKKDVIIRITRSIFDYLLVELKMGFKVKYWFPSHVEVPKWPLFPNEFFGIGTTYNGLVYHCFEIRNHNVIRFVKMCDKVIKNKNRI